MRLFMKLLSTPDMAEGRADGITDANEERNDLLEQQTEIEALQGIYDHDMSIIKDDTEYKVSVW